MKLLIAIPALNEEESIVSIIERTLTARSHIQAQSPVTDVEVVVVSDGSTDRTVERARAFDSRIRLIVFEHNRGYGAAIKEAWNGSDADILGFLDADGTCDPMFFAQLCSTLKERNADIVLGSRLNTSSRMPLLRRIGNSLFAGLLTLLSSSRVRDTASGMRVVRRTALPRLMPLPDGLHFTPAMSARAMLSGDLRIIEIDMPYHEREGESKLNVWKDGMRFLRTILEAAFLFRPSRPLTAMGLVCISVAVGLMISPTIYYLQHRWVLEWMIYRFIVSNLLGSSGLLLLSAAYIGDRIVGLTVAGDRAAGGRNDIRRRFMAGRLFWVVIAGLVISGILLVVPSFFELVRTGATYEHWSRFIVSSFLVSSALILLATWVVDYSLNLIATQLGYQKLQDRG